MIEQKREIKEYVLALAEIAQEESNYFPVDRDFIAQRLEEIKSINSLDFLYYNLEMVNDTYVNQLFLCLPEVWENISLDDIISISKRFTNEHSYFTLIKFTYRYIEVDIIETLLQVARSNNADFLKSIQQYLSNQWNLLLPSIDETEGDDANLFVPGQNDWMYIRQSLLTDRRAKPILCNPQELRIYIATILSKY